MTTRHPRYQDYVIKDGAFVGEFEEMYQDFDDPWEQSTREKLRSEKAITLNMIQKYQFQNVVELGCGLGHFTNEIGKLGVHVTGVDISPTAIEKAQKAYPHLSFVASDILNTDAYLTEKTDLIIMSEITWYILDILDTFMYSLGRKEGRKPLYLLHLLATYPQGVQKYGADKFTNLQEILRYFALDYEEYGEIVYKDLDWCSRTYFLAKL